jgi:hypothetical protein
MKARMTVAVMAAAAAFSFVSVAPTTAAEPGGPGGANLQAHFFDCTGPAGTPTSFDAALQHPGAAWHLTDSRQIFIGMIGFDETTNTLLVLTPGFERNAVPTVTCRSVRLFGPLVGHVFRIVGVLI